MLRKKSSNIIGIQFSLLSPDEIERSSVVDTYVPPGSFFTQSFEIYIIKIRVLGPTLCICGN